MSGRISKTRIRKVKRDFIKTVLFTVLLMVLRFAGLVHFLKLFA